VPHLSSFCAPRSQRAGRVDGVLTWRAPQANMHSFPSFATPCDPDQRRSSGSASFEFAILALEVLEPLRPGRCQPRPLPRVTFGLPDPLPKGLRRAACQRDQLQQLCSHSRAEERRCWRAVVGSRYGSHGLHTRGQRFQLLWIDPQGRCRSSERCPSRDGTTKRTELGPHVRCRRLVV
jgi:hypothetical protein